MKLKATLLMTGLLVFPISASASDRYREYVQCVAKLAIIIEAVDDFGSSDQKAMLSSLESDFQTYMQLVKNEAGSRPTEVIVMGIEAQLNALTFFVVGSDAPDGPNSVSDILTLRKSCLLVPTSN